ncbi:MAG: DUF255 domain-containing protein [Planctomycetaceae bacterium]|nr:MAG: DUF255 domain-containing protein [Planctomycetaceae bacterium]
MRAFLPTALASLTLVATSLVCPTSTAQAEIPWESDLRAARDRAEREGKLLLLHFYSDSCVWCDRLEAGAFQAPAVAEAIEQNFVPVKIHAGQNPSVARTFRINGYPTDVIVTPEGTALAHRTSPQAANRYIEMLSESATSRKLQADAASIAAAESTPAPAPATSPQDSMPAETVASAPSELAKSSFTPQPGSVSAGLVPPAGVDAKSTTQATPVAKRSADAGSPMHPIALDGYCPVSLLDLDRWVEGDSEWGVIHLGQLYLFCDSESMNKFLANPEPYTPVLNGIDVVRFFEEKRIVPGKRDFGARDPENNRMFFFADEAAMVHFESQHTRYTDAAIRVTRQAVAEANPIR